MQVNPREHSKVFRNPFLSTEPQNFDVPLFWLFICIQVHTALFPMYSCWLTLSLWIFFVDLPLWNQMHSFLIRILAGELSSSYPLSAEAWMDDLQDKRVSLPRGWATSPCRTVKALLNPAQISMCIIWPASLFHPLHTFSPFSTSCLFSA